MKNFWLSWYWPKSLGFFELHWPWWITGERGWLTERDDRAQIVVAGIQAANGLAAMAIVIASYDRPPAWLEWRFCKEKPAYWTPYGCNRFPRGKRMPDWPPATLIGPQPS